MHEVINRKKKNPKAYVFPFILNHFLLTNFTLKQK